ncbi:general substrate transporter [Cladochytrium replicatum]|nr:general substrate transporter [Cladochytrium replicatum]
MASEISKVPIKLWLILALVFINSANNGYDGSMFGSVLAFNEFKSFFNLTGTDTNTSQISSIINIGNIVGGFLTGVIVDFRGRRVGLAIGCLFIIAGAIIQGTTAGIPQMVAGRFIVGIGLPITVSAAPIFVAELSPPKIRGTLMGLYNTFWYVGSFLARATVYGMIPYSGELKWRLPLFLQMAPSVIVLLTIWILPESPRYLVSRGQNEKAIEVLATYHGNGDKNAEIVRFQMEEIIEENEREQRYKSDSFMGSVRAYIALFSSRATLHRLLLCWMVSWFPGVSVISYYLVPMLEGAGINSEQTVLGIGLGVDILSWLCAMAGAFLLADRIGRRRMGMYTIVVVVLGYAIMGACTGVGVDQKSYSATIAAVAFIFFTNGSFSALWTPLQALYPTEIWPFALRAKAVGIVNVFWGTSGYLFNWVNPLGLGNLNWKYYFVQAAWNGFWIVLIYFFMIETKGHTLEELDGIFLSSNPVKESLKPPKVDQIGDVELAVEKPKA